jgi:hypothetical protein
MRKARADDALAKARLLAFRYAEPLPKLVK